MASTNTVLHVHPHFNHEEAAHAAAEFVASLDNLPGEVAFLLEEISDKDTRIAQLLQRINTRHHGLTKHAKNIASGTATSGSSTPTFQLPIPTGAPLPVEHLTLKDQQAIGKIIAEWGKVEALQEEKIKLAERLERIVNRAKERGRAEWKKVGGMDMEEIEKEEGKVIAGNGELGGAEVLLPPTGLGPGSDARPYKKRKPNALPLPLPSFPNTPHIVHPPSSHMMPPPTSIPSRPSLSSRTGMHGSRHGRHVSTSTLSEDPDADGEVDVEGEVDEGAGEGDGEVDDTLYCTCQRKSYGEMIGCDNDDCQFEWFHVGCVGVTPPLPETWYCPDCVRRLGLASSDGTKAGGYKDKKSRKR